MANEIELTIGLKVENGNFSFNKAAAVYLIDQSAVGGGNPGVVDIGTTEETVSFGDIASKGVLLLHNLDSTNYVEYGTVTSGTGQKIKPGEVHFTRLKPAETLYMKADTAECRVLVLCFED